VADVAVECELERRAGETDLEAGSVALQRGNEVGETDRGVDRLVMPCEAAGGGKASGDRRPGEFELWSALKMIAMVGRTSETSAISMRPAKKGKKRRRATTCSAVSAGAPVRLSPSITSSKLTAPVGNSDTEVPPRSTGSSPVTARISALTASRTASAGIRNGKITRAPIPTAAKATMTNPRRLMPTAAVTTRLSQIFTG